MNLSGSGGLLRVGGIAVAELGPWQAEGDLGSMAGTAQATVLDAFYMEHSTRFRLVLQLGNREMAGECPSAKIDEQGILHFHWRRS